MADYSKIQDIACQESLTGPVSVGYSGLKRLQHDAYCLSEIQFTLAATSAVVQSVHSKPRSKHRHYQPRCISKTQWALELVVVYRTSSKFGPSVGFGSHGKASALELPVNSAAADQFPLVAATALGASGSLVATVLSRFACVNICRFTTRHVNVVRSDK